MLTCNMDVEERSVWLRATPGAAAADLCAVLVLYQKSHEVF